MNLKLIAPITFVAAVAITSAFSDAIILRANLTGTGKGKIVWKVRDRGNQMEAEFSAEGQGLPRNAQVVIAVGSNAPISATTTNLGTFNFQQKYRTSNRPTIAAGMPVVVSLATGRVLLIGSMQ